MKTTFTQAFRKKYYVESKYVLKHIKAYNKGKDANWSSFKRLFLLELTEYLKATVSPNTARLYCAYIKSLLNDYADEVNIPCRDYADLLSLKKVGVLNVYLNNEEISRLINYEPINEVEQTIRNQFVLSCLTGARHSDVVNLNAENISGSHIVFLSQKTKNVVKTVNSPIAEHLIRQGKNKIYSDPVYNDTIRNICRKVDINEQVKVIRAGKTESGEKWRFVASHTARRSFATNLYLHTKDIMLISKLMGHSDITVTQRYICNELQTFKVQNYFNQFDLIK